MSSITRQRRSAAEQSKSKERKGASQTTRKANAQDARHLPFQHQEDFKNARRGFIATRPDAIILAEDGRRVWDLSAFAFVQQQQKSPAAVHPSLWRQAHLNEQHGLFQVTERIYQIRGFDVSNMTIIEGDTGVILIDPLMSTECARAGLDLYFEHRPQKPVLAVLYTHSHGDHYGGVKGVISEEDVRAGKVAILAPEGFLEHAVSENVFAGNAMGRRAFYMYGSLLARDERGLVDTGLGVTTSSGTISLIPPTETIRQTGEQRCIDGVEMVFQMAADTEAPAEMLIYFPQFRALCVAEDLTHNLHNLYTLRGAEVRDAAQWWKVINEAIELFGERTDVVFAQHHWPTWGQEQILAFMRKQRDLYKYLHDQTLRLINLGYTMDEVAEMVQLPPGLAQEWYNRGYYGSVNHNVKAIYQRYLGFYSSHPSDLHPLPPEETARAYVDFMGGVPAVLEKARASFEQGRYRWVAQVMKHAVFAEPENEQARYLLADAFEQLGYQAECGPWRNEYLMGAWELRHGLPQLPAVRTDNPEVTRAMTLSMCFDYLGIHLNGPKAEGKQSLSKWLFTDTNEQFLVQMENCALTYTPNKQAANADATVALTRAAFDDLLFGETTLEQALQTKSFQVTGKQEKIRELFSLLEEFPRLFNIVTP